MTPDIRAFASPDPTSTQASRIFMSRAVVGEAEERLVLEALRSGWVAPLGPMVDEFERQMAARVGVEHALALSSGTAALHLALLHVGARRGTVVVLPSMTFIASANAVSYTGATPVFVDSLEADGNVDPELLLDAVRTLRAEGETVAAVMAVDLFGRCAEYDRFEAQLAEWGIPLVEDAAEALGARRADRAAGSFGVAAALSFNGNKILTTSGGGMLLSDDGALVAHARSLSTQARLPTPWYEHEEVGYNYRMSNLLAAVGLGQLTHFEDMLERRRAIHERYRRALEGSSALRFVMADDVGEDSVDNCWLTAAIISDDVPFSTDEIVAGLDAQNIETRHLWKPMHMQPVYRSARMFSNGSSARLYQRGITLPSGPELTDADIDRVIEALQGYLNS